MHTPPPTIRDVAAAAGVSIGLVSLAYHHPHRVRDATLRRIQECARRLGYRPNAAASVLRSRPVHANAWTRATSIAFLTAEQTPATQKGDTLYQSGVKARCEELGYGFERFDAALSPLTAGFSRMLHARGFTGIVLGPSYGHPWRDAIQWNFFSVVRCGGYGDHPPAHRVHTLVFDSVTLAWERLRAAGCRRIGAVFFVHTPIIRDDWMRAGALDAAGRFDAPVAPIPPLLSANLTRSEFARWMREHSPDGLIEFGARCLEWLTPRMRRRVRIVSLTHGDNEARGVSEVCADFEGVGRAAVNVCDQLIRDRDYGLPEKPVSTYLPPLFIARSSCP